MELYEIFIGIIVFVVGVGGPIIAGIITASHYNAAAEEKKKEKEREMDRLNKLKMDELSKIDPYSEFTQKLNREHDEIDDKIIYENKYKFSPVELFIEKEGNKKPKLYFRLVCINRHVRFWVERIVFWYDGSKIDFIIDNNDQFTINVKLMERKRTEYIRDVGHREYKINEYHEHIIKEIAKKDRKMLRKMIKSNKSIVRFSNDENNKDIPFDERDKVAVKEMFDVYDKMVMQEEIKNVN